MRWPWRKAETEDEYLTRKLSERMHREASEHVEDARRRRLDREKALLCAEGKYNYEERK